MPKISNFLWSRDFFGGKNSVYPTIITLSGEDVWKRWYDPDRLNNIRQHIPSADIDSLGLLFWEITWCKPENLPFKGILIENLYQHLLRHNKEKLPELPGEYKRWGYLINSMWKFKADERSDIKTVESNLEKLLKGRFNIISFIIIFNHHIACITYT